MKLKCARRLCKAFQRWGDVCVLVAAGAGPHTSRTRQSPQRSSSDWHQGPGQPHTGPHRQKGLVVVDFLY